MIVTVTTCTPVQVLAYSNNIKTPFRPRKKKVYRVGNFLVWEIVWEFLQFLLSHEILQFYNFPFGIKKKNEIYEQIQRGRKYITRLNKF